MCPVKFPEIFELQSLKFMVYELSKSVCVLIMRCDVMLKSHCLSIYDIHVHMSPEVDHRVYESASDQCSSIYKVGM